MYERLPLSFSKLGVLSILKRMTRDLRLAFGLSCCIIIFLLFREPPCLNLSNPALSRKIYSQNKDLSANSVFVYLAYLDRRANGSFIRLWAIHRCKKKAETFLSMEINGEWHSLFSQPIEYGCPWAWAKGCGLVPHLHEVVVPLNFNKNSVSIRRGNGMIQQVKLEKVLVKKEDGFTVCVPPIFWYTDWTKLIVFVEYWRLQGATQFFFYHLSSTEDVQKVFEYYGKNDWMIVLPWPLLPASNNFDPNSMVYRIAHSIAHNDCMMRTRTKHAVLLDIDELIYSKEKPFLEMVETFMGNRSSIGGALFNHHVLQYYPPLTSEPFSFENVDFKGVTNAKYAEVEGPKKVIFKPALVKRLGVHAVNQYLKANWKTEKMSNDVGILLHNRYNHEELTGNATQSSFSLVGDINSFQKTLISRTREIFPNGASFNQQTQQILGDCVDEWRTTQGNCKNPVEGCRYLMQPLEKWVETTVNAYTVF